MVCLRARPGFSLIELIIVIVIIGIIAAMAIPRISPASEASNEAALGANLLVIMDAIERYTAEHHGRSPDHNHLGIQDTDGEQFVLRLLQRTNGDGKKMADGDYGPYLFRFPTNPINHKDTLRVGDPEPGANTHGWQYDANSRLVSSDDGDGYSDFRPEFGEIGKGDRGVIIK